MPVRRFWEDGHTTRDHPYCIICPAGASPCFLGATLHTLHIAYCHPISMLLTFSRGSPVRGFCEDRATDQQELSGCTSELLQGRSVLFGATLHSTGRGVFVNINAFILFLTCPSDAFGRTGIPLVFSVQTVQSCPAVLLPPSLVVQDALSVRSAFVPILVPCVPLPAVWEGHTHTERPNCSCFYQISEAAVGAGLPAVFFAAACLPRLPRHPLGWWAGIIR